MVNKSFLGSHDGILKHMQSSHDLAGSRSSGRWASRPGNFDRLNLRAVFGSCNEWGIPDLAVAEQLPRKLVPYSQRGRLSSPESGDCVHFFLDDYRFETVWNDPHRCLSRLQRVGMSLSPDFSVYPEMPQVAQMWNVYRSRWCAAWMAQHGIMVIPTVTWSDERSHSWAFAGLPRGGVVAVSTVGLIRASFTEQVSFMSGFEKMISVVRPTHVLIYGNPLPMLTKYDKVDLIFYPARRNR